MSSDNSLRLMAVGDVYLTRERPFEIFGETASILQDADLLFGNQEGPISDRGSPLYGKANVGSPCLRAPLRAVEAQALAGFSAMTLANNHSMDYGGEALLQTIDVLSEHGIVAAGAGASWSDAHRPVVLSKNGTTIAMLGYTTVFPPVGFAAEGDQPGVAVIRVSTSYHTSRSVPYQPGTPSTTVTIPNSEDVRQMEADVRHARSLADVVVVQYHWGVSGYPHPVGYMKELGRAAVDAGAHLVIGNHPHLLLGVEVYCEVPILYNLNHFAFDLRTPSWPSSLDTLILESTVRNGVFTAHKLVVCTIDGESRDLSPADPTHSVRVATRLQELSAEFGTSFELSGRELEISGPVPGTPPPLRAPDVFFDPPRFVSQYVGVPVQAAGSLR